MDIRTYRARTMREALDLVRSDLGPQASVLHTRSVNRHPLARWLRGEQVEVAAAIPSHRSSPTAAAPPPLQDIAELGLEDEDGGVAQSDAAGFVDLAHPADRPAARPAARSAGSEPADAGFEAYLELVGAGVEAAAARGLVRTATHGLRVPHGEDALRVVRSRVFELLRAQLRVCGPIDPTRRRGMDRPHTVALVGPTGVGKTTTIAKLAAAQRVEHDRRVGLLTVDTYRVAAVDQLRTYAEIIDLPMEVVRTPEEMREARRRLAGLDLVLIDTAGRSPRDEPRLQELAELLAEIEPDEVHLAVAATSTAAVFEDTVRRFALLGCTALAVTKLDESPALGALVGSALRHELPFSYVTHGQNVPEDISVAERDKLALWMLGGGRP